MVQVKESPIDDSKHFEVNHWAQEHNSPVGRSIGETPVLKGLISAYILEEDCCEEEVRAVEEEGCNQGKGKSGIDAHLISQNELPEDADSLYKRHASNDVTGY